MEKIRNSIHPGLRGALFYSAYWGIIGLYEPFISVYFHGLGMTSAQIGWLAAVLPLCTLLFAPLAARLADRKNRRVTFLALACLGHGAAIMIMGLPGVAPSFPVLLGIVALYSFFRSPIISLADSLIAPMAVRHQLDFGSMRMWGSFIFALTASILGLLWQQTGYGVMFLATAAGFVPVVLAALLLEDTPRPSNPIQRTTDPAPPQHKVDPGLVFLLAANFLVIAAMFMAGTFGAIYMMQLGGTPMMVGSVLGIAALAEVPGMLFGSRIARRLGNTGMLLLAYGLNALGLAGYALVGVPMALLAFSAVRGLGFGMLLVGNVTIINARAPKDYTSTYQGVFNAACFGLAPLIGGPLSGWIYGMYGPSVLFFFAAGITTLAGVLILPTYWIWHEKRVQAVSETG
jgi:MFS transporter, PPP family, 3-phenylpropionic acid transporter